MLPAARCSVEPGWRSELAAVGGDRDRYAALLGRCCRRGGGVERIHAAAADQEPQSAGGGPRRPAEIRPLLRADDWQDAS